MITHPLDGTEALTLARRVYAGRIRKDVETIDRQWARAVITFADRTGSANGWEHSDEWIDVLDRKVYFFTYIISNAGDLAAPWQAMLDEARTVSA